MKKILVVVVVAWGVITSGGAWAQKDQMKMGEAFGTTVIKKGKMKAAKPMEQKKPEPVKTQEALEIDVKRNK